MPGPATSFARPVLTRRLDELDARSIFTIGFDGSVGETGGRHLAISNLLLQQGSKPVFKIGECLLRHDRTGHFDQSPVCLLFTDRTTAHRATPIVVTFAFYLARPC